MREEYQHLEVNVGDDGVGRIVLDRPPVNILNIEMMEEIARALEHLAAAPRLKAAVISARGKAFSAGVDVADHTKDRVDEMIKLFHRLFYLMDEIRAPTIAAVGGAALGGGCELATYCDIVIAGEKAKFGQPEIAVGVFPPVAAVVFPRLVGEKKAIELLVTGETISAKEALEIGLINRVVAVEELDGAIEELTARLAGMSAAVIHLTKQAIRGAADLKQHDGIALVEKIYLEDLMSTMDAEEGLQAFLEKRAPVWKDE
jgi:cyclohexa-1,5-dienecarbonyl-CoA hydratase